MVLAATQLVIEQAVHVPPERVYPSLHSVHTYVPVAEPLQVVLPALQFVRAVQAPQVPVAPLTAVKK